MRKGMTGALLSSSAALTALPAYAQSTGNWPGYWHDGWGWGHMFFGGLMMLLFWGGIILAIVFIVRWMSGGPSQKGIPPEAPNKALHILQERFAKGEIDKEEFEERKRLLSD